MAIFPTDDLQMQYVCYQLGFIKARLSTLCAKAKIGGEGGYAFKLKENGYTETQGNLIEGAEPLWNRFSNNSPGEFTFGGNGQYELGFRLKRDSGGQKYCFSLANFRGYNPEATPSGVKDTIIRVPSGVATKAIIYSCPSEYDWRKLDPSITQLAIVQDKKTIISEPIPYSPTNNYGPTFVNIKTTSPFTANLRLAPLNAQGDWSVLLPGEGKLEVLISGRSTARIAISTPYGGGTSNIIELSTMAFTTISADIMRRFNNTAGSSTLKEVKYVVTDSKGEIVYSKTRTNTYPTKETVSFDWGDVGVGSYIKVTIFVEQDVISNMEAYDFNLAITAIYK